MLRSAKSLIGFQLATMDGQMGYLKDIYFDDQTWAVRYLVVATSQRRVCNQVLITPDKITGVDEIAQTIEVTLTQDQIQNSPPSSSARPVCKQYELHSGASGWANHRSSSALHRSDPHLRSMCAVLGYQLQTREQQVGHVQDFLLDCHSWNLPYLVGSAAPESNEPAILIISKTVESISWIGSSITLDMSKDPDLECLHEQTAVGACA